MDWLSEKSFKVVLNVAADLSPPKRKAPGVHYVRFAMPDTDQAAVGKVYSQVVRVLKICLDADWKVLVHCKQGRSR